MIFHFFGKATLDVKKGIHWMLISIPFFFFFVALIPASRDSFGFLIPFGLLIT